jgi:hypothetical protein
VKYRFMTLLILLIGFGGHHVPVAAAEADPTLAWSVSPVPRNGAGKLIERPAFDFSLAGGKTIRDIVRINNYSEGKLTLALYAQDGINTPQGGFDLLSRDEVPQQLGNWVRLSKGSVTVAGKSRVDIPFTELVLAYI